MPMYEYRCRACGHTFDRLRPASDADAPVACDCGSDDTGRLLSMIARRPTGAGAALPMAGGSAPAGGGGGGCCGGGCCS